ncbi:MAG: SUMF1/EgtB/PvdO family nonheme iron enzyme [Lysobacterales bacterium]
MTRHSDNNQRRQLPGALCLLVMFASGNGPAMAQSTSQEDASGQTSQARPARLGDSLAVDPGQEWTPGQQSASDRQDELRRKLALGNNALDAGNLLEPFDASALNYFRQALAVDPGNADAEGGLNTLADRLLQQAAEQLTNGDMDGARATAQTVRGFRPDYGPLARLVARMDQQSQIANLLAQGLAAFDAGAVLLPAEASALGYFDQVFSFEAANPDALQGLQSVIEAVQGQVNDAIGSGDFDSAQEQLDLAESAFGATVSGVIDASEIQILRQSLASSRAQSWQADLDAVEQLVSNDQLDEAQSTLAALVSRGYPGDLTRIRSTIDRRRELLSYVAGSVFTDPMSTGGEGPLMVVLPAGSFDMGSAANEEGRNPREGPLTRVTFEAPFALSSTEVTVAQFSAFVAATNYQTTAETGRRGQTYRADSGSFEDASVSWRMDYLGDPADGNLPVIHVSWEDAAAYAGWLSDVSGQSYRLPSESEFEYAQRGGTRSPYWWGDGSPDRPVENLTGARDDLGGLTWPDAFSRYGDGYWGPSPAGSLAANPWNLYDLSGNVLEWAADCFADTLEDIPTDGRPRQVRPCSTRSLRGGGWAVSPSIARSASRASAQPLRSSPLIGFRVAKDL